MRVLKENLSWIAPTAAILAVGWVYLDRETDRASDVNAQIAAVAATVESIQERPSTAEQLSVLLEAQESVPEVTRAAPLDTPLLVEPEIEAPAEVAEPAVQPVDPALSIGDDPAAFFASAQANLAVASSCGDDLRALAAEARIYFPAGGLAGTDSGLAQARLLGQVLRDCPGFVIQVEGHSDPSGDPQINLVLSQQRAEAIVARLAASGIDTALFVPKGFGDVQPSGVTGPEPDAYYDRRVEFSVVEQVQQASFTTNENTWQVAGCAARVAPLFEQTKVYYQPGSITVPSGDLDAVFALATEAAGCNEIRMRIVGQHSDAIGSRESIATGRLRALAIMNTLVAAGFKAEQILIGAPSWSEGIPGQPGLPNSRVDFQIVPVGG